MINVPITPEIQSLIDRGAVFVANHSGGKDSQAMFIALSRIIPAAQLVVVHADLGEVEWDGALEHIRATIGQVPLRVCRSRRSLLQMIVDRGKFPSPQQRQCTSDLKRGPIEREIRQMKVPLIVNCMGMRAQESPRRAKLPTFKYSARNSKAGREWYDWLPIHDVVVEQVFATIASAGQSPHWAYAAGMSRFSCCFCIMSSKADLPTAAQLNPRLYSTYVELEKQTGNVMMMPTKKDGKLTLEQITGIKATEIPLPWPKRSAGREPELAAHR